jgi:AcrR family transcriptional regulator
MARQDKLTKIYEESLRVFAKYGYKRTRVEDVANELGMTKGNIYLYVKNKRELYEKAVAHGLLGWQSMVSKAISNIDDSIEKFYVMCKKSYMYLSRDVSLRTILINDPSIFPLSRRDDPFYEINRASMDMLKSVLEKGIQEGKFREVDVDHLTELLFSIYVMFIIKTYVKSDVKSGKKMFEQGIDIVLHGLLKR